MEITKKNVSLHIKNQQKQCDCFIQNQTSETYTN